MYLTQTLHQAVSHAPTRTLTVCGARQRTATEVYDRVSRLASGFQSLGVAPGDRVAILALNSDRYHETFFATWWSGAAINPVNIRWSVAEIVYSLHDAGSEILLVDDAFLHVVPELLATGATLRAVIYCGDGEAPDGTVPYEELIAGSDPVEDLRVGDDTLAAVFYTGGTTGNPKGVMMSHRGLMTSALTSQAAEPSCLPDGVVLIAAPMFHMAAVQGWVQQHLLGGAFVFLPTFDPLEVLQLIERHRVSRITLVPTMLQRVLDHPDRASYDLSSVWTLGYGASPISETLLERALEAFPGTGIAQGYGMTETGIISLLGRRDHRIGGHLLRSAGRAVPLCEVKVVDASGAEVPRGEVGEVVVRADQVMLGYWNLPELTAETIVEGWMHTGDAARMDQDGYLYLVDRLKDMIITGGENVFSAEVENALASHPAVHSCAVIGIPDPTWGETVHAVVVLAPDVPTPATSELVAHVRTRIAGYKVPRSIEVVEALPISAAGKILKRELRDRHQPAT